ncbi:MAG: hypothetical protein EOO28_10605 [Comamonadaceae bacterium]|nr:MAG: hypothetical protein EOO28_10605 [Comamonadaceae bacterium]
MKSIPDILRALSDEGVEFVLVGGFAVQLHGFVRTTLDLDLALAMDEPNLTRFIAVARRFSLAPVIPAAIESLKDAALVEQWHREKGMLAFALREPQAAGSVIDVLVRPDVPFETLLAGADTVNLFGRRIRIASLVHLIDMKRIANRPKDRIDVEALEKIQRGESPYV